MIQNMETIDKQYFEFLDNIESTKENLVKYICG